LTSFVPQRDRDTEMVEDRSEPSGLDAGDRPEAERPEEGTPDWGRRIASGGAALFGAEVVGNAGFFVAAVLLARGLSPSDRGTVAFLTVAAVVVARVIGLGMRQATTVFAAQRPNDRAALLSNLIFFNGTGAVLGGALTALVLLALTGHLPGGIGRTEITLLVASLLGIALLDAGNSFLLGCQRFRQRALITAGAPWLWVVLVLALSIGAGLTVTRVMFIWAIMQGVAAVIVLLACLRGIGLGRLNRALLRESIGFGVRAWLGNLATFLTFRADYLIMGFLATEAALGFYAVAVNASEVLLLVPGALTMALLPVISQSAPEARRDRVLRVSRSLAIVMPLLAVIAALLGPVLVPLVFGSAYEDSVVPFLVLLPGALGYAAMALFTNALTGSGSPGRGSLGPAVALAVGVALDFALIPPFGATGAAAAASGAYVAGGVVAAFAFRSRNPFSLAELVPRSDDLAALRALTRHAAQRLTAMRAQG
jgi:O-antigen/teichoic acid export membrane protein